MRADLSLSIDRLAVAVFGKRTAAVGVPMRTLQERISQRDYKNKTTLTYADYAPLAHERKLVERRSVAVRR